MFCNKGLREKETLKCCINPYPKLTKLVLNVTPRPAVSVVGLGYVGAVSTACLASLGHRVVGVDLDPVKVRSIAAGHSPIHEKDLGRLLSEGVAADLISATDDLAAAVAATDVTFVSVGTPTAEDGGCDHRYHRRGCPADRRRAEAKGRLPRRGDALLDPAGIYDERHGARNRSGLGPQGWA